MAIAIGIDLGGNNIKGVLLNDSGEVIYQASQATEEGTAGTDGDSHLWKNTVSKMVLELKSKSTSEIEAIGLAAPGLPNKSNSAIRIMPGRLKGLENLNWSEYLNEKEVRVLNDAHAALIAEAKYGIGKGINNVIMLTLGTGVGGGILINGELYQGNYQMAGHLGHMTFGKCHG
jgi:glucokinase